MSDKPKYLVNATHRRRIQKWVDALRSKKYKQTRQALTTVGANDEIVGHCCLAVGDDVFRLATKRGSWGSGGRFSVGGKVLDSGEMHKEVAEWFGMKKEITNEPTDPSLPYGRGERRAIALNDSAKWSFSKIADAIEKKFLKPYKLRT